MVVGTLVTRSKVLYLAYKVPVQRTIPNTVHGVACTVACRSGYFVQYSVEVMSIVQVLSKYLTCQLARHALYKYTEYGVTLYWLSPSTTRYVWSGLFGDCNCRLVWSGTRWTVTASEGKGRDGSKTKGKDASDSSRLIPAPRSQALPIRPIAPRQRQGPYQNLSASRPRDPRLPALWRCGVVPSPPADTVRSVTKLGAVAF